MAIVSINNNVLDILFHVLPDKLLLHDIMIGQEVLSQGLEIHITVNKVTFFKTSIINACTTITSDNNITFDNIVTDIPLQFKSKLLNILTEFKEHFVYGTPSGFANTDPVEIRLIDPCKTVYRRPYRLSSLERSVVRDKVDELIACKVIRPSTSPLARSLELLFSHDNESEVDIEVAREQAVTSMNRNSQYDKTRFDSTKAKVQNFVVGDYVLLQNEERNQCKLDAKFKGPFRIIEVLDGDRYVLKALNANRTYKFAHDRLRKMPDNEIPGELFDEVSPDSN